MGKIESKAQVTLFVEKSLLKVLDKAAKSENRSRANFFLTSAVARMNMLNGVDNGQVNHDN